MVVSREDIIARTKLCMEELTPEWDGVFEQTEGVCIDRYIDAKIEEILRALYLSVSVRLLPVQEALPPPEPVKRQDGSGRIILPDEVIRPVSLYMEGWKRPVVRFIDETHPLYELQFNRYTRGGVAKPVAIWGTDGVGRQIIDYFSLPASYKQHRIVSFYYVAVPKENAASYDLHPVLLDALCYRCGAAVYDIMGNHTMAEILSSHAAV